MHAHTYTHTLHFGNPLATNRRCSRSLARSLARSLTPSTFEIRWQQTVARSLAPLLARSLAPSLPRSQFYALPRSFGTVPVPGTRTHLTLGHVSLLPSCSPSPTLSHANTLFWAIRRWIILTNLRLSARCSAISPAESRACSRVSRCARASYPAAAKRGGEPHSLSEKAHNKSTRTLSLTHSPHSRTLPLRGSAAANAAPSSPTQCVRRPPVRRDYQNGRHQLSATAGPVA